MAEERSLLELAKALKIKYQEREYATIERLFYPDHPLPIEQCYLHLALVEEKSFKSQKDNDASEKATKESREYFLHEYERIQHIQRKLKPEELLAECWQTPKRIYIEGAAGAGKTILSQFIAFQWASDHPAWKQYKFLFCIRLRDLTEANYPASEIYPFHVIEKECFKFGFSDSLTENEKSELIQYLKSKDKKVLFILDGYDELSLENKAIKDLWGSIVQSDYDFIITSRPGMQKSILRANLNLAVLGFSDEQVKKYIDYFFDPMHTPDAKVEDANQFLQVFRQNTNLWSLAHTPIQLELLCNILGDELKQAPDITLTRIYTLMLEQLLKRYEQKRLDNGEHRKIIVNDIDIEPLLERFSVHLEFLEKLAFFGMEKSNLVIPRKVIDEAYKGLTVRPKDKADFFTTLRNIGLVTRDSDGRQIEFIHLTFQEYFAARYIARCFRLQQPPKLYLTLNEFIAKKKYHRRYEIVWWFVAGLLKDETKLLGKYFNLLQSEPNDFVEIYQFKLQLQCLEECELQINQKILKKLLKKLVEWLQRLFLQNYDTPIDEIFAIPTKIINKTQIVEVFTDVLRNNINCTLLMKDFVKLSNLPISIVEQLIKFLENKNDQAYYAADILSNQTILPEFILQNLMRLLDANNKQMHVVNILADQSYLSESILNELMRLLNNKNKQKNIAHILSQQTVLPKPILYELEKRLNDEDVQTYVVEALSNQSSLPETILLKLVKLLNVKFLARNIIVLMNRQTVLSDSILYELEKLLTNKDKNIQECALRAISWRTSLSESILLQLIEMLNNKNLSLDVEIILYRQSLLSESILQRLLNFIINQDMRLKWVAADIISGQGLLPESIFQQLRRLLNDEKLQGYAIKAISSQVSLPESILQQLINKLDKKTETLAWTVAGVLANQNIFPSSIHHQLNKLLIDENVQLYVMRALSNQAQLPEFVLQQLGKLLDNENTMLGAAHILSRQNSLPEYFQLQILKLIVIDPQYKTVALLSGQTHLTKKVLVGVSRLNLFFHEALVAIKNVSVTSLCSHLNKQKYDDTDYAILKLIMLKCLKENLSLYFYENVLCVDGEAQGEFSVECQILITQTLEKYFTQITGIHADISTKSLLSWVNSVAQNTSSNIINNANSIGTPIERKESIMEQKQPLLPQEKQNLISEMINLNQASRLFLGDEKLDPSHLDFNTWYHPDICHYLLQLINNNAKLIRVIFHDSGYDNNTTTFKKQLKELILLSNCLNRPAFFIGKEPGADDHFIGGIVKDGQLLFINPLGITQHRDCYQIFAELINEKTLNKLWFSNNLLQRREYETKKLVSCGPIISELAIHVLTTLTPDSFRALWEQLKKTNSIAREKENLSYTEVDIKNWLPEILKKAQSTLDVEFYKETLCNIRLSHYNQLQNLPIARANTSGISVDEYLQKCKNESPAQVIFNTLVSEEKNITNINELPEYQLLKNELGLTFNENKNNQSQSIEQLKNNSSNTNAQSLIDRQNNNSNNQQVNAQSLNEECQTLAEKGAAYFVKQQFNQGMECFNKALAINPNHFESLYYKGYYFLNVEDNLVEAQKWFNQTVNTNVDIQNALHMNLKSQALCYLERYKEAISCYNQILQKPFLQIDSIADYLTKIGRAYLHLGSYKEAHDYYLKAINTINNDRDLMQDEKNARLLSVTYYRARAYLYQGNYTEAQFHYENAQRYKSVYLKSVLGNAFALFQLNRGKEATDLCQSVFTTTTDNVYNYLIEALIHFDHQEYVKVIEKCDKVLVVKPRDIYSLLIKGMAYFHQKNYTEAIEYFDKILARYNFHVDSLFYKACAFYGLEQKDEALDLYNKVKIINPEFSHSYEMPILMYDYWVQKYNLPLSHTESESPQLIKEKNKEIKQAELSDFNKSINQSVNFSSRHSMVFPFNKEEIKKYLKIYDKSKYTDISHALENLSLFETDISDKHDLWQKPISDLTEDDCVLLYGLASEFFMLHAEEIVLDKLIYECLDDEQKPLFSYAQLWLPEHAILHNNVAVLETLLKYRQPISLEQNKINDLLTMALSFSLSPAMKGDRDDIVVLLLNAGAHLDNLNLSPSDVETDKKNVLHQIHLPIPTSLIWDKRLVLQPLTKDIVFRFYKNRYQPSALQPHQKSADIYLLAQFKQAGLSAIGKDKKLKQLEKQISETLNIKAVIVNGTNHAISSHLDKESFSFEEILNFGKAQKELLNQTTLIISENNLSSLMDSTELENSPTIEFINRLTPNQVLGFIKLGALYEVITGWAGYLDYYQDRVFYLLNKQYKKLINHAQYWNLHYLCSQCDIDDTSLLTVERILTVIENKDVDVDINAINSYGLTCLDKAIKATRGIDSKTGLHVRNNGKLCLLLLKHGAKANKSIDDLVFSPSRYSEYKSPSLQGDKTIIEKVLIKREEITLDVDGIIQAITDHISNANLQKTLTDLLKEAQKKQESFNKSSLNDQAFCQLRDAFINRIKSIMQLVSKDENYKKDDKEVALIQIIPDILFPFWRCRPYQKIETPKETEQNQQKEQHLFLQQQQLRAQSTFLEILTQIGVDRESLITTKPKIYFMYAWPLEEYQLRESGVQSFLQGLHDDLTAAGIEVIFDKEDNFSGNNLNQFMGQILDDNCIVLVFGTESFRHKWFEQKTALHYEGELLKLKWLTDFNESKIKANQGITIIPWVLTGIRETAIPENLLPAKNTTERALYSMNYCEVLTTILAVAYEINEQAFIKYFTDIKLTTRLMTQQTSINNTNQKTNETTFLATTTLFASSKTIKAETTISPESVRERTNNKVAQK